MKKGRQNKTQGRARRALKSWTKGKGQEFGDEEAVPRHSVPMKPRHKEIQQRENLDLSDTIRGRVIDSSGRGWIVETRFENNESFCYECVPSRSVVSENAHATLIAVGDVLHFRADKAENAPGEYPHGVIMHISERRSRLSRKTAGKYSEEQVIACNIDQLIITMAAADPFYNKRLIDRYLVAAAQGELHPVLVVNKIDLMDVEFLREDLQVYNARLGLPIIFTSAVGQHGVDDLRESMRNRTSVLSGPSGAGKSSLINAILGYNLQATGEVSRQTSKGMHTTTFSRMIRLPFGGYIVDTPGIREFGIWDVVPDELSFYFDDFAPWRESCRFGMCTHTHEPGCGVKEAVENGEIDPERYASYLNMYHSMES